MRFLAVEVRGVDSPVTRQSRAMPAVALDVFLKVPQAQEEPAARAVCQARGGSPADREAMLAAIRQVDPDVVRMPCPPGVLRVSARFPLERTTPEMQAVASFSAMHRIWAVWCMVADGVMFLRMMAEGQPDSLAAAMRQHLQARGIDAQVEFEEASDARTREAVRDLALVLEQFRQGPKGGAQGF